MIDKSALFGEKKAPEFFVKKYTCNSCGATFCTDKNNKVNTCFLCGKRTLNKEEYNDARKVFVISFAKDEEDVLKDYKKKVSWNPLVPKIFKNKKAYKNVQKVFLPAFLVNVNQNGNVIFLGGDKEKVKEDGKKVTLLKKYEIHQTINIDYKRVLLNVSTRIDNKLFVNICDYDFSSIQKLDTSFIQDAVYLLGDVEATEIGQKERERISKYSLLEVRKRIPHDLKKFQKDDSSISFYDAEEILVPIYVVDIRYKDKVYSYYMNGQNGSSYFSLPVGVIETILFSAFIGGFIFLIVYLFVYYW